MQTGCTLLMNSTLTGMLASANVESTPEKVTPDSGDSGATVYKLPRTDLTVSRIAYGCAWMVEWTRAPLTIEEMNRAGTLIRTALDNGITFFDMADVYGMYRAETAFGRILKQLPSLRDRIVIQSKCGVLKIDEQNPRSAEYFDCSRDHILAAVDASLKRLGVEYLDILLLHYADALVDPHEVAGAFDDLHQRGKVRYFGVSNHSVSQIELLKSVMRQPIVVNQIPIGLANHRAIAGTLYQYRNDVTDGTRVIDYCRREGISLQAYSALSGVLAPAADASETIKRTSRLLHELARSMGTNASAIALAWLLRHPANILPVIGTANPHHLKENCEAFKVKLGRKEWYELLASVAS